jgi:RNA polymerase sigma factor (sigma-70 family)
MRMIHYFVRQWSARIPALLRFAYDERFSEGCRAAVRAARDFDPSLGHAFGTYLGHAVRGAMTAMLSRPNAARRGGNHITVSLEALSLDGTEGGPMSLPDVEAPAPDAEAERRDEAAAAAYEVERCLSILPRRWREVITMRHLEGLSRREAGTRLGVSKERVRQMELAAMSRMRERLQHARET